jgi:hypothetical protein
MPKIEQAAISGEIRRQIGGAGAEDKGNRSADWTASKAVP